MKDILKNRIAKGIVARPVGLPDGEAHKLGEELRARIHKRFGRSFHIREVDTGSCGACESEIIAATNPIYDIQRFGIDFVASPRHADALLVTGPVSANMALALRRTYDAMPEPKLVITLGDCALDGGVFKGSYYVAGGVKEVLPVDLHIPGCPPSPLNIIKSLLDFLKA
ncbi:MAG: NADH-quinone oxidoreductase subunit B family protein [Candidatus Omnitrophica bacterium]|nr:NADH-quinone oxidoreductase subunit B family protein [Candidatus Omnitrophota bacterium]